MPLLASVRSMASALNSSQVSGALMSAFRSVRKWLQEMSKWRGITHSLPLLRGVHQSRDEVGQVLGAEQSSNGSRPSALTYCEKKLLWSQHTS